MRGAEHHKDVAQLRLRVESLGVYSEKDYDEEE